MKPPLPPRRDFAALESRRLKAAEIFRQGHPQAEVVHTLGVSRQTASQWHQVWLRLGQRGLKAAGRAGRKPRLGKDRLRQIEKALLKGPLAHGFSTELWTLERIAQVIHRRSGVHYHPGHVWRVLGSLGWSRQKPLRRAKEHNPKITARWHKHRWPTVKKTLENATPGWS